MKNTGKPSEKIFDEYWARLGKRAFVFAFTDASEARGTNKKKVYVKPQPSDRLVVFDGYTFFAEIKSTVHETRFDFSLLRATQGAFAAQAIIAGGAYEIFIHALAHDTWYRISYHQIRAIKESGKSSLKWTELKEHLWLSTPI